MDFVPIFGQVQGVLLKANNTYALSNLRTRGGNEEKIKSVVDALAKVLTERRLLYKGCAAEEYSDILRKINFFLILNSDLIVLEELSNSDDIGHLIWITPMITKCLLMHMVWGLDLHEFFCEALRFSNPALSLEILDIATEYARYSTPDESVKRVVLLVSSTYEMVIRMSQRRVQVKDQKVILVKAHNKLCELLKYFSDPPNKSKMSDWTMDRLYLHAGTSILLLFEHLIHCFNMFSSKPQQIPEECGIYEATYDETDENFSEKKDNMDDIVAEYIDKINQLLLESAKNNVMAINVDIYCSWCEHLDAKNPNKSLQRSVGEAAYQLCEVLKSDPRLENEVTSMLPAISCRPENISDHISQACRETMMERSTEKHANQGIWLAGLIRKNYFFFEEDCLKCAINNISCLLPTDVAAAFKQGVKILYEPVKYEYANYIKLLVLKCLSSHSASDQMTLIKETFVDYTLSDRLELEDYEIKQTEFFNKLLEPFANSDLIEMYSLFIQNPTKFYRRTFKECVVKPQQSTMMLTALTELKVFSQLRIEYEFDPTPYTAQNASLSGSALLILHAVKNMHVENLTSEVEKLSYVFFIKGLVGKELASDEIIILKVLMPSIHKHLTEKNCDHLQVYLRALQEIFSTERHARFIAPLLVMLAQIMEYVRWDLSTFTVTAAEVLKSSIIFQSAILKSFLKNKQPSDNEFKWLATKLTFLTPMNAHYFQELWPQQYFKELYDPSLGAKDSMICLCYLLPRSLVTEWKTIFSGMCLKNDITACFITVCSVVKFIMRSAEELGSPNAFACVEHCCRNAAKILQEIIVAKETNAEKLVLIKSVISVINGVPSRMRYVCFSSFLTPLTPLVTSYVDLCERDDSEVKKLMSVIEELSQEESRSVMRMLVVQGSKP